jgi:site-specific DNA-methyltransferase (adenine-specific)
MGKVFVIELNKTYNENCLETMKRIPTHTVDLTITSPPYDNLRDYNGYDFDFEEIADELYRITNPGGVVVWVVGDATIDGSKTGTSFKQALHFKEIGFDMYDVFIYEKSGTAPPHKNRYFNAFEYMFVFSKGKPDTINLLKDKKNKYGGTQTFGDVTRRGKDGSLTNKGRKTINEFGIRTNIWRYNNGKGFTTKDDIAHQHPAIFPEKLVQDHILSWSNTGDLVYDCFMGSGTTAKVAIENNRNYIGSEISKEYCDIIDKRLINIETNVKSWEKFI